MTYSYDLRKKVLGYIENGGSKVKASQIFGVTVQTLINWCKRKDLGNLAPNPRRQKKPQKLDSERLRAYIQKYPDHYLREIAEEFGGYNYSSFLCMQTTQSYIKKKTPFYKEGNEEKREEFRKKLDGAVKLFYSKVQCT